MTGDNTYLSGPEVRLLRQFLQLAQGPRVVIERAPVDREREAGL